MPSSSQLSILRQGRCLANSDYKQYGVLPYRQALNLRLRWWDTSAINTAQA